MASLRKATSIGTLWALCSSSASSPSSPKLKPPPPQGNHPHVPQKTGRPDHVGPSPFLVVAGFQTRAFAPSSSPLRRPSTSIANPGSTTALRKRDTPYPP